jgi:RHS repeat-associated protein
MSEPRTRTKYTYDSFGKLTASSGSLVNPFQYTARESDAETGLYYYRARYYDPTAGRFLSEDPIGFSSGPSLYAYVSNSSASLTDPYGLSPSSGSGCGSHEGVQKKCFGEARVIGAGKPGKGAFGPTVPGSLAVIPTQLTGGNDTSHSAYIKAEARLRPILGQISVAIVNPKTGQPMVNLGPITDVIAPRKNAANIMREFPGELIIEVNGVPESNGPKGPMRFLPVVVTVPASLDCPTGTTEKK